MPRTMSQIKFPSWNTSRRAARALHAACARQRRFPALLPPVLIVHGPVTRASRRVQLWNGSGKKWSGSGSSNGSLYNRFLTLWTSPGPFEYPHHRHLLLGLATSHRLRRAAHARLVAEWWHGSDLRQSSELTAPWQPNELFSRCQLCLLLTCWGEGLLPLRKGNGRRLFSPLQSRDMSVTVGNCR